MNSATLVQSQRTLLKSLRMLCREGKLSLASFISGIIITMVASILVLNLASIGLDSFWSTLLCFSGPIITYLIFCVIAYFVTSPEDFAVRLAIPGQMLDKNGSCPRFLYLILFILIFIDNQESNDTWCMFRYIGHYNYLRSIAVEAFWCIFPFHVNISLHRIFNDCMGKSAHT